MNHYETYGELAGEEEWGHEAMETGEYEEEWGHETSELGEVGESPLSEAQEMELATELLEISSEEELEQFLGNVFKSVAKGVGGFMRGPVGRALGGVLKQVAKTALPLAGGALGSLVAPGIGTALGSKLGSMASNLFEMELEGMPQEQQEFEIARRYVQLAALAARNAALAPRNVPANAVARAAFTQSARRYAPGLLRGGHGYLGGTYTQRPPSVGSWRRRGNKLVIYGLF